MWIIASLPLWLLGAFALVTGTWGTWCLIRDGEATGDDAWTVAGGFSVLMLSSAAMFYLAAKVAS